VLKLACVKIKNNWLEHGCSTFSLLLAALSLFLWLTEASEFRIFLFFGPLLFCFHTWRLACTSVWPFLYSVCSNSGTGFLLMHGRHNDYFKLHVHGHIHFHRRPQVVHPCIRDYLSSDKVVRACVTNADRLGWIAGRHAEYLKNGACGLSNLVIGFILWVQVNTVQVHVTCWHWLSTNAAFTTKASPWQPTQVSGDRRLQTTHDTPKEYKNRPLMTLQKSTKASIN